MNQAVKITENNGQITVTVTVTATKAEFKESSTGKSLVIPISSRNGKDYENKDGLYRFMGNVLLFPAKAA